MNKVQVARLISFAFHPIVFALLVPFLVVYKQSASFSYGLKWVFISSFFLFLTSSFFFLLRPKNTIKDLDQDLDISHKESRHIFYVICALTAVLFFIVSMLFKGVFFSLSIVALGIVLGIILLDLLNFYMKVSIHAAIATAYVLSIFVLYGFFPFLGVVWILPVLIWARLYLKKHTKKELFFGVLIGSFVVLITIFIAKQLQP